MNEYDSVEFERLKQRQESLQSQINALTADLEKLRVRLAAHPQPEPVLAATEVHASPVEPTNLDFVSQNSVPPPLPPVIQSRDGSIKEVVSSSPAPAIATAAAESSAHARPARPVAPPPQERGSFEMRLGTYWLVRIGIVMLLTGLVFLGTYAYKNFIGRLSAGGKVALLYAAGAGLLGLGTWLQRRREKDSVRNYGQVLFAGGLATVYFTTYAAHYLPLLRIIESAVTDGLLLLA